MIQEKLYAHKLGKQELGYSGDMPGQRGRYFYISKENEGFFPVLSKLTRNDAVTIAIVPPFSNDRHVLCRFVYHNDKFIDNPDSGRNEMRLYLNKAIDIDGTYYKPNDIVLFTKYQTSLDVYYKLHHIKSEDSIKYDYYNKLIEANSIGGRGINHALLSLSEGSKYISISEEMNYGKNLIVPDEVKKEVLNSSYIEDVSILTNNESESTRLIRSTGFRDLVSYFYERQCAITGKMFLIHYKDFSNFEAAHIQARFSGGPNLPSNGLLLDRNLHWAFDKGFFTIGDDYKIIIHNKCESDFLNSFNGKSIFLPMDQRAYPHPKSLKWHQENMFGLFLRSGHISDAVR